MFRRHRVVPLVDRRKTWSGFLGGVGTTLALAVLAGPYLTPMDYGQSFVAGLLIGIGGFAGDLCMAAVKRDLHVSESGFFLPGHGGVLDRLNSLTYTAPLFFHYVYWLFHFHTNGGGPLTP